jgi:hypothetical protein
MVNSMTAPITIPSHSAHAHERRKTNRFPFREGLRYRILRARSHSLEGYGRTIDMSSGGVRFTTEGELPRGRLIELSVSWPARLDGVCPLQFVAAGRVIRSDAVSAVVRIERYEFKTRKAQPDSLAAGAVAM